MAHNIYEIGAKKREDQGTLAGEEAGAFLACCGNCCGTVASLVLGASARGYTGSSIRGVDEDFVRSPNMPDGFERMRQSLEIGDDVKPTFYPRKSLQYYLVVFLTVAMCVGLLFGVWSIIMHYHNGDNIDDVKSWVQDLAAQDVQADIRRHAQEVCEPIRENLLWGTGPITPLKVSAVANIVDFFNSYFSPQTHLDACRNLTLGGIPAGTPTPFPIVENVDGPSNDGLPYLDGIDGELSLCGLLGDQIPCFVRQNIGRVCANHPSKSPLCNCGWGPGTYCGAVGGKSP